MNCLTDYSLQHSDSLLVELVNQWSMNPIAKDYNYIHSDGNVTPSKETTLLEPKLKKLRGQSQHQRLCWKKWN